MDIEQKWLNEVMSQNIDASIGQDFTRLIINFLFIQDDLFKGEIKYERLTEFVYRFYIDNIEFAQVNPSPIIKNIYHYKPVDLSDYCYEQLMIWKKEKSYLLNFNKEKVFLDVEINSSNSDFIKKYQFIVKMLFIKFYKKEFWYTDECSTIANISDYSFDKYLKFMKNHKLKNRLFETSNYCPLCDECEFTKLNVVHLKKYNLCNVDELNDIHNLILLCETHCEEYLNNYFNILKNGYLEILKLNENLDKRMHLGIELLSSEKKKYLKELNVE